MTAANVLEWAELCSHVVQCEPDSDDVWWLKVKVGRVAMKDQRRCAGGFRPNLVLRQTSAGPASQAGDKAAEGATARDRRKGRVCLPHVDQLQRLLAPALP
eukprot:CAMPEP_0119363192 /NCGR_PEP_ID=MMETSP1334-20130426/10085_1 /TAXON_ID=127549 /ORGANISM="Calcidiscus leptoporus, Strain RCC1130" /LENGTH=100 /DNA_ID=CAMNT_0007378569 /DNA_START=648 /DNA_END=950 /DNA_ORIENTATION=+